MSCWTDLFCDGKYSECSEKLTEFLSTEKRGCSNVIDGSKLRINSLYFQHNKIICDALSHVRLSQESEEQSKTWVTTFVQLNDFCDLLTCEQAVSDIPNELPLVTTLNLLWWSWETLAPPDGLSHDVKKWIMHFLRTELSRCEENSLDAKNVLDLLEACISSLQLMPSRNSHIVLDIITSYLLLSLQNERREDELSRCVKMLDDLLKNLPQLHIHMSIGKSSSESSPQPLLFLGPNGAHSDRDIDLSVSLVIITIVLFAVAMGNYEKAWRILQDSSGMTKTKCKSFIEYLKAFVCFKRGDLDKALYHTIQMSATPLELLMIKRRNLLSGQIYFLKKDYETALEFFSGRSELSDEEDQLPGTVFFLARSYGALKRRAQQIAILECLTDVLRGNSGHLLTQVTRTSSLHGRLLGCLHKQPEVTLLQTLLCSASALLEDSRAEDASKLLLEALKIIKLGPEQRQDPDDVFKVPPLAEVMRDAVTSLLIHGDNTVAGTVCRALIDRRLEENQSNFNRAVARMLLVDVESEQTAESRREILFEAVRLLTAQKAVNAMEEIATPCEELIDLLLARAYYRKSKLFAHSGLKKDADVYLQRAVTPNRGDAAVVRNYRRYLAKHSETDSGGPFVVQHNETIYPELNIALEYVLQMRRQHS